MPDDVARSAPGWRDRLRELGLVLPPVVAPLGAYLPARRSGNMIYTSGQLPVVAGVMAQTGKVGRDVTPEEAHALARVSALNGLGAVDALVGLDAVAGVVKVVGYVASDPTFTGQPAVVNGASELLAAVFGDSGRHARSAVGVVSLPLDAPVEIELVLELR